MRCNKALWLHKYTTLLICLKAIHSDIYVDEKIHAGFALKYYSKKRWKRDETRLVVSWLLLKFNDRYKGVLYTSLTLCLNFFPGKKLEKERGKKKKKGNTMAKTNCLCLGKRP